MLSIIRLARQNEKLRVVRDQIGCPSWSRTVAEVTTLALRQALGSRDIENYTGMYNVAASGQTSWHRFAEAIVRLIPDEHKKCRLIEGITTSEYPLLAKRPANSVLSCEKLYRIFGLRLPHWEQTLEQAFEGSLFLRAWGESRES